MSLQTVFEDIYKEYGKLDPVEIEVEARKKTHPLHDHLEWDNKVAGTKYRQIQVQKLIRSVVIMCEVHQPCTKTVPVRSFVSTGDDRRYIPLEELKSDQITLQEVRAQIKRDLEYVRRKWKNNEVVFNEMLIELSLEDSED